MSEPPSECCTLADIDRGLAARLSRVLEAVDLHDELEFCGGYAAYR
jgi:hypothetical protein